MIAVIVPTIREEKLKEFLNAWEFLFLKHNVTVYVVKDGVKPVVEVIDLNKKVYGVQVVVRYTVKDIMGKYSNLIYNFNDGVRNLGFAQAYKDGADIFISLDDDTLPEGDTIQDHLDILNTRQPISWMNTTQSNYMRGVPYKIRTEAEVVLSHGNWKVVADFDAPSQLVLGTPEQVPLKMPIPKGVFYPMCIMNCAFKRKLAPYFYQAPAYDRFQRFSDIWAGIESKKVIDKMGWSVVTGFATVRHERASNVFTNLKKEVVGIEMNEDFYTGNCQLEKEYQKEYEDRRKEWFNFLKQYE